MLDYNNLFTKKDKIIYFSCLTTLLVVLILLRLEIFDISFRSAEFLKLIIDNLSISILTTLILSIITIILIPKYKKKVGLSIIYPKDIKGKFKEATENTDIWFFSGSSGKYNRIEILPKLVKSKETINIKIILLDFKSDKLLENYISYKKSLNSNTNQKHHDSIKLIKIEILTTIIACCYYYLKNQKLNIEIGFKSSFSLFRIDVSKSCAIVTQEDPKDPAFLFEAESHHYTYYKEEIVELFKQFEQLQIKNITNNLSTKTRIDKLDNTIISEWVMNLNISVNEEEIGIIIKNLKNNKHAYQ